jgi:hypothetical protein
LLLIVKSGNFLKGVTPELALLECILKDEYNYQKLTDAKFVAIKIYGCQHELVDVAKYKRKKVNQ